MKFILRTKPNYSIYLYDKYLTIEDDHRKRYNGDYEYSNILEVNLNKERINWFTSIFSLVIDLIFAEGFAGNYKDKAVFELKTKSHSIKTHASDFDQFEAKKCIRELRRRMKQVKSL